MKKLLRLGALVAIVTAFVVSLASTPAKAADVQPMVVGGNPALQQYGAISLWYPDRNRCAASLINQYWAVTAAHCQPILIPGQTEVRASSKDNTQGYEQVGLEKVYIHPGYNDMDDGVNDLALIRFQHPVKNSQPLKLAKSSPAVGTNGILAGWGWICQDFSNPDCGHSVNILQELNIKIVDDTACGWSFDPKNQLCGVAASGDNANGCHGDSGAPLVRKDFQSNWILMGVTFGDGDYDIDHPNSCGSNTDGGQGAGLWMDVAKYYDWIFETMYGLNSNQK